MTHQNLSGYSKLRAVRVRRRTARAAYGLLPWAPEDFRGPIRILQDAESSAYGAHRAVRRAPRVARSMGS